MELEKSEHTDVLGSLYTLRGGLSAISVEYDKAQSADDECYEKLDGIARRFGVEENDFYDKEKNEYAKPKDSVDYADWLCRDGLETKLRTDYKYRLDGIKEQEIKERKISDRESYKYESEIEKYHKSAKKDFIIMAVCFIPCVALIIGFALIVSSTKQMGDINAGFWFLAAPGIALFITSMCFMGAGISYSKSEKEQKQKLDNYFNNLHEERNAEAERVAKERKAETERVANERKAVKNKYDNLLAQLPAVREEARAVLNERNATISPLTESCNIYHKALTEQFTYLLDERDWQHLDLVIYQLETRRADSIKEALQLVDRELQTERLESSIMAATKSICFTLAHGFTSLLNSININCDKISKGLFTMSADMNAVMSVQNKQLAEAVKGQLAELNNSVNIGNALQAKANETSARLVDDVAALRYFNTDLYV